MYTLALSSSTSSLSLLSHALPLSHHHLPNIVIVPRITFLTPHRHRRRLRITSAIAHNTNTNTNTNIADDDLSWFSPAGPALDAFNGWAFPETRITKKTAGFPTFLVAVIGSVAVLVAALAYFSRTKNGFRLPFTISFPGLSVPFVTESRDTKTADSDADAFSEVHTISGVDEVESSDIVAESMTSEDHRSEFVEKRHPRVITVAVDSIQQEALFVLKKLKIIDENVRADQLCTRREYVRWLVQASSLLERNAKYKITKAVALAGSVTSAFEDVDTGDQDFDSIQALAEAGVVLSKLSSKYNSDDGDVYFYPERFISRRDLIDWRAQVEYDFAITRNQESRC